MIGPVIPYCGVAPLPVELAGRWNLDPILLALLVGIAIGGWQHCISRVRFVIAFALLLLLFISPVCAVSSALFAVRETHHLALTSLIAPLLAVAFPTGASREPPLLAWTAAHAISLWAWHVPALYSLALSSDAGYWLMQMTLLGSAFGFWRAIAGARAPTAIAALVATMIQMGLLGALLTFGQSAFFAEHWTTTAAWGLSPLQDQQLAGLIMWVPAAGLYLLAALRIAAPLIDPLPSAKFRMTAGEA